MKELEYFVASDLHDAFSVLTYKNETIRVFAGGTDLVVRLKQDMVREDSLLDISRVKELSGIYESEGFIHVLPLTTHTEIVESDLIKRYAPILRDACLTIGSPQIRNKGTIGGNVANASPAGDSIPALFAHEAMLKLESVSRKRVISVEDFFVGPGKTTRKPDELLTDIFFSKFKNNPLKKSADYKGLNPLEKSADLLFSNPRSLSGDSRRLNDTGFFKKVGQRKGTTISVVNVAVNLRYMGDNRFSKAVVSFGAVAPTVVRGRLVEKAIIDSEVDSPEKILYISRLAFREVSPIDDIRGTLEYRRDMSINLLYEGLLELFNNGWRRLQ